MGPLRYAGSAPRQAADGSEHWSEIAAKRFKWLLLLPYSLPSSPALRTTSLQRTISFFTKAMMHRARAAGALVQHVGFFFGGRDPVGDRSQGRVCADHQKG